MMQVAKERVVSPVLRRFAALTPLDAAAIAALETALASSRAIRARDELQVEGCPVPPVQIVASGWAARVRLFRDGRRQFLSFLLPGDVIGLCDQPHPLAISTIAAFTPVTVCRAPDAAKVPSLAPAYAASRALHEAYLLEQIVRLGRLTAHERIVSFLLELHERLTLNGMADGNSFDVPLTQESLGDALGLTPVHVNRMIQQARRGGDIEWRGTHVTLGDPRALADWIGWRPVRVSGSAG